MHWSCNGAFFNNHIKAQPALLHKRAYLTTQQLDLSLTATMADNLAHNINMVSLDVEIESLGSTMKFSDAINTMAEEQCTAENKVDSDGAKEESDNESESSAEGDSNTILESTTEEVEFNKQAQNNTISKVEKAQMDAIAHFAKQPGETDAEYVDRIIRETACPDEDDEDGLLRKLRDIEEELMKVIICDMEREARLEANLAALEAEEEADNKLVHDNDKTDSNCNKTDLVDNEIESSDSEAHSTEETESPTESQSQSSKESDATKGASCKNVEFTGDFNFNTNTMAAANNHVLANKEAIANSYINTNNDVQTNKSLEHKELIEFKLGGPKIAETESKLMSKAKPEGHGGHKAEEIGQPKIIKERHRWCVKYLDVCQTVPFPLM